MFAIWEDLDLTRAGGFNGPAAISLESIQAWSQLSGRRLSRWAVRMLILFDLIYRHTFYEMTKSPTNVAGKP